MNYLTNYYKNLSEQLQEKIDILEARINAPEEIKAIGSREFQKSLENLRKSGVAITPEVISQMADEHFMPYARRAERRRTMVRNATAELGGIAQSGDVETATQIGDVMADMARAPSYNPRTGIAGKVARAANLDPEDAQREIDTETAEYEARKGLRNMGSVTSVPANIPAMKKFIKAGRGQYQPPLAQPPQEPPHTSGSYQY